ncbi:MAG: hypothetical protein JSS86_18530 [Cyanobacteria bacterium SZAS LIN-2]|nr:hypothetical protein [Cyanobacteria bacterium SZAS LIN-2]MBS2008759.1 hypothetical protein [Cyanobacteria bacterium SZAS TMP-1]
MFLDLSVKTIMLLIGYFGVARFIPIPDRIWGLFVAIAIWFSVTLLQSHIAPWPFGIPYIMVGYIALGVFCKAIYKPDQPKKP